MADVDIYPIDDVVEMASESGFTVAEIRRDSFADANLAGLMASYYEGTLGRVIDPGSAQTRSPEEVFRQTFISGVGQDVSRAGEELAAAGADIAGSAVTLLKASPILLLGAAVVAILVLSKKVG